MVDEDISSYAMRISNQIDKNQKFGIIGISFGGMVAIEMNKYVRPSFTILILSACRSSELPSIRTVFGNFNILKFLPNFILKPPLFVLNYMFGAKNKLLLKEIISDTDPLFLRWAVGEVLQWESDTEIPNLHLIHGTADKIIPLVNESAVAIDGGGHFMIVDKADEVSKVLNRIISGY
jgi:pimeloyl-ACP methyl ester carboxylesterase